MKRLALTWICCWLFALPLAAQSLNQRLAWAGGFYHQGDFAAAALEYQAALNLDHANPAARLGLAKAYRAGGRTDLATTLLQGLANRSPDEELLLGLCLLDLKPGGLFLEQANNRQTALPHLAASQDVRAVAFAREAADFVAETPHHPWVAGGLSALVPGAGSASLGRWREGAYAAFFTLGFGLAAKEQFQADRLDLGLVFGSLALIFYSGNIYAAANSAFKMNDEHNRARYNQIRGRFGIWFDPRGLLVEMRF